MKKITRVLKFTLPLIVMFLCAPEANGQFLKKLGKAAERAAERTVERRVEQETAEKTDEVLDDILEPGSNEEESSEGKTKEKEDIQIENEDDNATTGNSLEEEGDNEIGFKRGSNVLYQDDFSQDAVGDFPAQWNSSLGGEVKKLKGHEMKFLKVTANSVINLETTKPFPDNFTVELDVIIPQDAPIRMAAIAFGKSVPQGLHYMLTSENDIRILFSSRSGSNSNALYFGTKAMDYQYKSTPHKAPLNQKIHVGFEINGTRFRVYIDGKKTIDLPRAYQPEFRNAFFVNAITSGDSKTLENYFYISNVVVAETGTDMRSSVMKDLIEKGNFTTNDILFASNSDNIAISSKEILDEIGEAIESHSDSKFMIVGHTDSDGETNLNLTLSQKRAAAVKNYLVSSFNIDESNLETGGKGESEPIGDNSSADGKAQNRRVEFIKQ